MFGWLKRKRRRRSIGALRAGWIARNAFETTLKLRELIERHPTAILDVSHLPLPKPTMKLALKITWKRARSDKLRAFAESAYLHLSHFQDGLGERVVDGALPEDGDPERACEILGAWVPWAARVGRESAALAAEFDAFKRGHRAKPHRRWWLRAATAPSRPDGDAGALARM
jgi:hypothetical protein